jgi:NADH-quinone oxidoreductase subunit G
VRVKPRFNPHVNRWWMCDEGRFGYEFIDQDRIEFPQLRAVSGELQVSEWEQVLQEVSTGLKTTLEKFGPEGIGVVASGQLSNEELFLIRKVFAESMGVQQIGYRNPWEDEGFEDDFLIRGDKNPNSRGADKNPNSRGAEELGLTFDVKTILEKAASGEIKILYIFCHNFENPEAQEMLEQADYVIFQGTNWNKTVEYSNAVLPGSTHAEKDGTFTNFEGRLQQFQQALLPLSESKADIEILRTLAQKLEVPLAYLDAEEIFKEWSGRTFQELEEFGELVNGKKR